MAITATGQDALRSVQGRQLSLTGAWAALDSQTDDGRFSVMLLNSFGRFPEDVVVRLIVDSLFTKTISGLVKEAGVAVARVVRCYRRSDGHFVAQATSDSAGAYAFSGLKDGEEYFVIAFDDTGAAPNFNAMILDQVIPA